MDSLCRATLDVKSASAGELRSELTSSVGKKFSLRTSKVMESWRRTRPAFVYRLRVVEARGVEGISLICPD